MILSGKLFSTFIIMTILITSASAQQKDCVDCGLKQAPGAPLAGNKSISKITSAVEDGSSIDYYIIAYCMGFTQIKSKYEFKKEMIESMQDTRYGVDKLWQYPGCTPNKIGGTSSPIVHYAAEVPSSYTKHIKSLHDYYVIQRKDRELWLSAINAKNTRGETLLDYIVFLKKTDQIIDSQKAPTEELIKFVCANGGVFATNKKEACPQN